MAILEHPAQAVGAVHGEVAGRGEDLITNAKQLPARKKRLGEPPSLWLLKLSLSKRLWLVFCLCFPFAAQAQYRFDSWTADNGLPQNSVYGIVQTRDGYLWFTTFDGLVRFDGVKFAAFNKNNTNGLASNRIQIILAEADDTLWLGTEDSGLV
ncbi:MAG: hypothetical protein M3371_11500, partial [Acidobacteriota bacterium]|nr:hypothetical protein [Acidobacteriota bacterium]